MPQEFFNDAELDTIRRALGALIGDLQTMQARAFDFSKQRLRKRLEGINNDLTIVIRTLPADGAQDDQFVEGQRVVLKGVKTPNPGTVQNYVRPTGLKPKVYVKWDGGETRFYLEEQLEALP
jgi:hypothetical protein